MSMPFKKIDYSTYLSSKVQEVKPSATLTITAKAKEMASQGIDVVNLGAGEPDFPTPQNIKNAAIEAINQDFTYYTPASGISELKLAVTEKMKKINSVSYLPEQICISCGAKHSIYNILQALLNPGDEVLIPKPYWVSYPAQVTLLGGTPKYISTGENFKVSADTLEEYLGKRSKIFILNYPSNPTGATYSKKELQRIADILLTENIMVISDEVYEYFTYDERKHTSFASLNEEAYNRTVTINSLSKTYSMTGWRIGYAACPQFLSQTMSIIQGQSTSNPTSIAQKAAIEALRGPQDQIAKMVKVFDERRRFVVQRLHEINGITCIRPEGAFYAFPKIAEYQMPSSEFSSRLLEEEKVALIPGDPFGSSNNIRISFAASMESIQKGCERLESFCKKIS
jgi:aspartate aminotransferase